ncbi:hypothetical protein BJX63DRAFT_382687 [Aspergillus granulosus]|uniref:Uncharacterized protein n=1 Tax=Aspergillus granulosus TaxID=176169 RepID=A0ABR4HUM6_9EURO
MALLTYISQLATHVSAVLIMFWVCLVPEINADMNLAAFGLRNKDISLDGKQKAYALYLLFHSLELGYNFS